MLGSNAMNVNKLAKGQILQHVDCNSKIIADLKKSVHWQTLRNVSETVVAR
jgi:hypothetical protein